MIACPNCGFEVADDSVFCSQCGTKLAAPSGACAERKTITSLFCDLVAFTAMSEAADPEDVDALLRSYHAAARKVIESHGGTVEKFIGDAVVGVFGVPAVHEDDPERAVRASLRLIEALEGMTRPDGAPLQARVGVNTGEALVRLDVDPASGRGFLTGDVVNTAARLEAAAPPGGIVVGALTRELTERAVVYEELTPVVAKGKTEPVAAWLATGARARFGVEASVADLTPLVGREVELAYLSAMCDKAVTQASPQFALFTGEPGIGKSRLVRELSEWVDARTEMIVWRQGHCPPFGEDVTYWALAEIVKAHAGIRDTDDSELVAAKLDAVLPAGPDHEWFGQRLRALLGLSAPDASREQSFAAWLRFFEGVAAADPTVLVFEDLHWADDALLDFLEYLTSRLADVPLLLVCTARPELFERRPSFAAGSTMARVTLGPLSPGETGRLVATLLGESLERARAVGEVAERCGGNPFYAEQSARLLTDTDLYRPIPDSVQAVIAARLDALPAEEKALLGDAAVVGNVFWAGALAALGGRDDEDVEAGLARLLEHRLVRSVRESSMEGEREYMFAHTLAREVGYRQLPRVVRARRHAAVAAWIEQQTGERASDFADVLGYHLSTAFGLAEAVGDTEHLGELRDRAVEWLQTSGDRTQSVDVETARRHYERALEVAGLGHPVRGRLLRSLGDMLTLAGEYDAAAEALQDASVLCREQGDLGAAVRALLRLHFVRRASGRPDVRLLEEALSVARLRGPSRELIAALNEWAWHEYDVNGDLCRALEAINEAVSQCAGLGAEPPATVLASRGLLRIMLGDLDGVDEYRRAVALAQDGEGQAAGLELSGFDVATLMCDYPVLVDWAEGPAGLLAVLGQSVQFLERRGMVADASFIAMRAFESRLLTGDWQSLAEDIDDARKGLSQALFQQSAWALLRVRLFIAEWTGRLDGVERVLEELDSVDRTSTFRWRSASLLISRACLWEALGCTDPEM